MSRSFRAPVFQALATLLVLSAAAVPASVRAQTDPLCFTVPEITDCVGGRFLQFWQQNGGLAVFGYPITPQQAEETPEGSFQVQYFERERFEAHPDTAPPYDVQLGRLGDQLLQRQGIDWQSLPKADPSAAHYFPETGHAITFEPFYQYWEANGLQDPALNAYQRSLALFGYPLTEAATETNSSGDTVLTQWFERARFEYHPDNPDPYKVLLGLLGTEWHATPAPPPGPAYDNASTPVSLLASLYDAINRQDYTRALGYWQTPPATPEQYAQGYANTARVQLIVQPPTFIDAGAGNLRAWVSSVLVAAQRDGSTQYFSGCYQTHKVNIEPNTVWQIEQAQVQQVPENSDVAALLRQGCGSFNVPGANDIAYDVQDSGVDVLASFYNAVSRREYRRAYDYWETPPSSFDAFVQGYADTASVQLIVQPPTFVDAGAGQRYVSIPTVLLATHTDGSTSQFAGCYTAHSTVVDPQPQPWRLSSAAIAPAPAGASIPALLGAGCAP